MAAPTALDYVTLGIAGVGAATGLGALGATWMQFRLSGPRLKVTAGTGYATANGSFHLYVTVENIGRMPVMVHGLALEGRNDKHMSLAWELANGRGSGPALTHRIEPSDLASWQFDVWPLLGTLIEDRVPTTVRAFATSGSRRVFTKKPVDLAAIDKLNRES